MFAENIHKRIILNTEHCSLMLNSKLKSLESKLNIQIDHCSLQTHLLSCYAAELWTEMATLYNAAV